MNGAISFGQMKNQSDHISNAKNYSSMTLDEKLQQFRPKHLSKLKGNIAIHELMAVYEIFCQLVPFLYTRDLEKEAQKKVWQRLFKSGGIFRTNRRMAGMNNSLRGVLSIGSALKNDPYQLFKHPKTQKDIQCYEYAIEILEATNQELREAIKYFEDQEFEQDQGFKDYLAAFEFFGIGNKDVIHRITLDAVEILESVVKSNRNDPNAIVYRDANHLFAGNFIFSTREFAFGIKFHDNGVHGEFIWMISGDEGISLYNLVGEKATFAYIFRGLPKWLLRIASIVDPNFAEHYRDITGDLLEKRLARKSESQEFEHSQKQGIARIIRRK